MRRLVDVSLAVPHGFRRPPPTGVGVRRDVRARSAGGAFRQSAQAGLSTHTGSEESARHVVGAGKTIDGIAPDRLVGPAVDLTPPERGDPPGGGCRERRRAAELVEGPADLGEPPERCERFAPVGSGGIEAARARAFTPLEEAP